MDLSEYRGAIADLPFGKRLPAAVYVLREEGARFGDPLDSLIGRLVVKYQIAAEFNVIKFRTDELKISFLSYPDCGGAAQDGFDAV